jgi:uncharacterized protein
MKKIVSDFTSKGIRCAGTLYLPDSPARPAVVIMAHALGAERSFGLQPFAERFAGRGMAAFVFDYRNFGDSDGEPRNLINPWRHVSDWLAAIEHVRALDSVDGGRIALWGSSFSGGHVIAAAARSRGISAIVSQVPFVNGISLFRLFSLSFIRAGTINGLRDLFRIITFRKPHMIPIVAKPDTFALMNTHDSWDGYTALIPKETSWKNECPARACLMIINYRPMGYARRVECPAYFLIAKNDSLVDYRDVEKTARRVKNAKFDTLPVGHFDVYRGELFEKVVAMEEEFLLKALGAG